MLIPQAQYEYSQHELISFKAGLEKYLFKNGFLSLTYENNFKSNVQSGQFGFRYDLPFAQTGFTARQTNDQTTLMEMARGSLIVDQKTNFVGVNNRVSVGKGGIVFAPFLDLNCNNKRDNGEPKAYGLNIRLNGGTATKNDQDTTVRVMDLEPYTDYIVELDANSFDNVAWKIHNKTLKIVIDPNSFKLVEIPVSVVGEVSGMVLKEKGGTSEGLGRIVVNIFNPKSQLSGKTLSEQDGYFSYLGLAPGDYEVKIDSAQLKKLHLLATPEKKAITIKQNRDGEIVEGIDFTLKSTLPATIDSTYVAVTKTAIEAQKPFEETNVVPQQNVTAQSGTNKTDQIFLQVGAFKSKVNAHKMATSFAATTHYPTVVAEEGGWYKVWFGAFATSREADLCKNAIVANGILAENLVREIRITKTEKVAKAFDQTIAQQAKTPIISATVPTTTKPAAAKPEILPATQPATQPTATVPPTVTKESPAKTGTGVVVTREATQIQDIATTTDTDLNKHYYVQISAFIDPKNSTGLIKSISNLLPYTLGIVYREHFYKVRYGPFHTLEEVNECIRRIVQAGIMTRELLNVVHEVTGVTILANQLKILAVSYTHLTLPTNREV